MSSETLTNTIGVGEVSQCYRPPSTPSRQNFELERADETRLVSRNDIIPYQNQ
jgi:hypothetical protein